MAPFKGRRVSVVVLVVASIFGMSMVSLRAAGSNPLDAVLASLAAISTSVNTISNTLNPEPAEVLTSTGVFRVAAEDTALCMVANVSDRDISIDARLVNWDATTLAYLLPYTFPPGQGRGVAMPFEETSYVRCEFKFTGFANEVRGTLNVTSAGGTPTVVIDAR